MTLTEALCRALVTIIDNQEKTMSALDDLKAIVAASADALQKAKAAIAAGKQEADALRAHAADLEQQLAALQSQATDSPEFADMTRLLSEAKGAVDALLVPEPAPAQ